MTSKVQKIKDSQGYMIGAACCKTCRHFTSDMVERNLSWSARSITEEKNKRCSIGDFAVQSTGHCRLFERAKA